MVVAILTERGVAVNVPTVAFAATKALLGTFKADGAELVRLTEVPPVPAGLAKVTVPVIVAPLATSTTEVSADKLQLGGLIVNTAGLEVISQEAVISADVCKATPIVATGNVTDVAPDGTVTVDGTVATVLLLTRFTTAPPAGAVALIVTVAVEGCVPKSVLGASESAVTW